MYCVQDCSSGTVQRYPFASHTYQARVLIVVHVGLLYMAIFYDIVLYIHADCEIKGS